MGYNVLLKSTSPVSFCFLLFIFIFKKIFCVFKGRYLFIFKLKKFFYKFIYLFILKFLAALGLRCCARAFSSCSERGLLFVAVHGLLIAVASLVVEHRL